MTSEILRRAVAAGGVGPFRARERQPLTGQIVS